MAVVSIINFKGGVGKTTMTLALSDFLSSLYRKRVLLIDLDPQANLTIACIGDERWAQLDKRKETVADLFDGVVRNDSAIAPYFVETNRTTGAVPVHLLATLYLGYLGVVGELVGVLLWPAVALHLLFTGLLAAERTTAGRA